ncbi:MAG: hypothetical protein ACI88H_001240 [Cocleimonas sp.]|jgi:hypothetical protein
MKHTLFILLIAISTMSWGLIDVGSDSLSRLFFDQDQQDLPAFTLAFVRFALATLVLILLPILIVTCRNIATFKSLLIVRRSTSIATIDTLFIQQTIYGAIWGISISFFVMAFQITNSGEFIFILGLCGFTIFHELVKGGGKFNDRLIAIISFNVFIMAFYLFGVNEPLWLEDQAGNLLFSIGFFIITYHLSFEFKRKVVMTDDEVLTILPEASHFQIQWFKMLIQFISATIIALFFLVVWALDNGSIQLQQLLVERVNPVISSDILVVVTYIIVATVISYFSFNYGVERLNDLSANDNHIEDGSKVSASLASLEPLTACLIAIYSGGETKWYLLGSIIAFMLYMAYLSKRNHLEPPLNA